MGMLFNTPGTNDVGNAAITAFNSVGMAFYRRDQANWANTFAGLPGAGHYNPRGGTYNLVTGANLPNKIQPSAASAGAMPNWRKWLGFFDTQVNTLSDVANEIIATTVGKAISDAISNAKFSQVEFYMVPTNNINTKISAAASDFQDGKADWSKIVTIYTTTFDKLR